jgi:hypothetical protein
MFAEATVEPVVEREAAAASDSVWAVAGAGDAELAEVFAGVG